MHTDMVRLNITLPKDLVESLQHIAGPRKRSKIISESIRSYLLQKQKADMEKLIEEGYRATAKEDMEIARDYEAIDLEGWDEY